MVPPTVETESSFAWFSGLPTPFFNFVSRTTPNEIEMLLAKAPADTPLAFWVYDETITDELKKKNFQPLVHCPLMTRSVERIDPPLATIKNESGEDFYSTLGKVFEFTDAIAETFQKWMEALPAENFVLYEGDLPIGTVSLVPNNTVGGIFNLAVLPEYQKKGYGRTLMQHLMHRAHILNLKHFVLQSTPAALPLYNSLQFEEHLDIAVYIHSS